jgi:hypothetical protein
LLLNPDAVRRYALHTIVVVQRIEVIFPTQRLSGRRRSCLACFNPGRISGMSGESRVSRNAIVFGGFCWRKEMQDQRTNGRAACNDNAQLDFGGAPITYGHVIPYTLSAMPMQMMSRRGNRHVTLLVFANCVRYLILKQLMTVTLEAHKYLANWCVSDINLQETKREHQEKWNLLPP